jgi:hypothetical protein
MTINKSKTNIRNKLEFYRGSQFLHMVNNYTLQQVEFDQWFEILYLYNGQRHLANDTKNIVYTEVLNH